jgi:ribosome-binding ATPase
MLSVGLVGLPNAGKSTLFNTLTQKQVPAENYPFCTIEPHTGLVKVPDDRLDVLGKLSQTKDYIYAAIEFRDIAGLVKNASKGEGLGNQFLSHIAEVDLILMVVRTFKNDDIIHVENKVDPYADEEILLFELTLHDQLRLEKMLPKIEKEARTDKKSQLKIQIVESILKELADMNIARTFVMDDSWDEEYKLWRKSLNLLTDKPILKVANIQFEGDNLPFPADFEMDIKLESELVEASTEDRVELGAPADSALDVLITRCYDKLNLATYLTTGEKETKAWTYTKGMKAPQCAAKIHSDFEKRFIKADIVAYNDFVATGGWKQASEQGKVRSMGKDYIMQDGDVVEFKLNA